MAKDVIKILERRSLSRITLVNPKYNHMCPFKDGNLGDKHAEKTKTGGSDMKIETEWSDATTSQGSQIEMFTMYL